MCFEWLSRRFSRRGPQIIIATGTRLGERSRRSSRELRPRVAPSGIRKRHNKPRRRSPKPWRRSSSDSSNHDAPGTRRSPYLPLVLANGKSTDFTGKLIEMVLRHDRQRLLERRQSDDERVFAAVQDEIDRLTLIIERLDEQRLDDGGRAEKYRLQQCIDDLEVRRYKCERERMSVENLLDSVTTAQAVDEEVLFAAVQEYIEECSQEGTRVRLSEELHEHFRDARQLRDFVRGQEEILRTSQAQSVEIPSIVQDRSLSARQKRASRLVIDRIERAMPTRKNHLHRVMHKLYSLARVSLLEQNLMQPGHRGDIDRPQAVTGYNDDTGVPPLDPADVGKYERFRNGVVSFRLKHDEFADTYHEKLAEFLAGNPGVPQSDFDRQWKLGRGKAAENLHIVEVTFLKVRDRVLAAGGEMLPLRLNPAWDDIDEFAGRHPEDGTVGCVSKESMQALAAHALRGRPRIETWLDNILKARPADWDDSPASSHDSTCSINSSELAPWDSISSQERRPRARDRIRHHQKR